MEHSSLLLVEGKSEVHVINELCKLCNITVGFDTEPAGSLSELKKALPTLLKATNRYKKIWVIIDADNNFDRAWQSIRDILTRSKKYTIDNNLNLPSEGIIINPNDPDDITIGVWIMPNNTDVGMLEDFLMNLTHTDDSLFAKSSRIIEELEGERKDHSKLYKSVHKSKAQIHTWLSWHDAPGQSLSVAVQKRLFDTDADLCTKFHNWLTQLNN